MKVFYALKLMHIILLITPLLHVIPPQVLAARLFNFNVRDVCQGTSNGITSNYDSPENRINALRLRYENCQYVDGNLEITGLDHQEFYSKDLSFLNSIREVTGYVLIANVFVQNVTLENLTIIRGDTLYNPKTQNSKIGSAHSQKEDGYALFVSLNFMPQSHDIGMRLLIMKNLTEISKGDVLLENNNLLCFATTDIYWKDILVNETKQKVQVNNDMMRNVNACRPGCHEYCMVSKMVDSMSFPARYCWGPGPKNCQKMNKVTCHPQCDGGRCFGSDANQCCHAQCSGGCDGPSKMDCWGCKNFYNDGGCEPYCPQPMLYDNTNFKWLPNPNRKYAFGKFCIKECPKHFLEHKGSCVKTCPEGFVAANDTSCVACTGPCPKRCKLNWEKDVDFLNSANIDELAGCTSVEGHMRIIESTVSGDPFNNIPAMPLEKLDILKSVKEITDYLLIHNLKSVNVTSFSFLSNLEKIQGRALDDFGASLSILNNEHIEYLGFTSLRTISSGNVIIKSNKRLCYMDHIEWKKILSLPGQVFNSSNGNPEECGYSGMVCHEECRNGCWGPGSTQCVACMHATYKGQCVKDCTGDLLFTVPGTRECGDCHPECKTACIGPNSDQCDGCKNNKDGPFCVSKCPNDPAKNIFKYPDDTNTCQTCHENCIDGCTGPGNYVGAGGCNACEVSLADETEKEIILCLNRSASCPSGYFVNTNARGSLQHLKNLKVCTKCHPECLECEDRGNVYCTKCKNYKNREFCVEKCDTDFYAEPESKQCLQCHKTCRQACYGPTNRDCLQCAHFKVYDDSGSIHSKGLSDETTIISSKPSTNSNHSETKQFYCLSAEEKCPADKPRAEFDELGMDLVCVKDKPARNNIAQSDQDQTQTVIAVVCSIVISIIGILVGIIIYIRRRWQKRAQKFEWMMGPERESSTLEPLTESNVAPDMSRLKLITEEELRRGGILGSGAFGTVYKGVWLSSLPDGKPVKIPVAIKVLQEGNTSHKSKDLLDEARVMASVDHPCCVRILAICMTEQMMLITQLMPLGCLLDYVKNNKQNINSKVMLNWCTQIAKGMSYLEWKGIVHRDLAARNVLVHNTNQVKITDFGLAKLLDYNEGEYQSAGGKMPIKWLALESIQHRRFTHKTDVWSYGVTLWEIFTYGQKPYEAVRARDVPELLEKGERLPQPGICTIDVYMIMIKCWTIAADCRPSFSELTDEFAKMSRDPGRYLVIEGDSLMRLPSVTADSRDMVRNLSLATDDVEEFMDADEYCFSSGMYSPLDGTDEPESENNGYQSKSRSSRSRLKNSSSLSNQPSSRNSSGYINTYHLINQNVPYSSHRSSSPSKGSLLSLSDHRTYNSIRTDNTNSTASIHEPGNPTHQQPRDSHVSEGLPQSFKNNRSVNEKRNSKKLSNSSTSSLNDNEVSMGLLKYDGTSKQVPFPFSGADRRDFGNPQYFDATSAAYEEIMDYDDDSFLSNSLLGNNDNSSDMAECSSNSSVRQSLTSNC